MQELVDEGIWVGHGMRKGHEDGSSGVYARQHPGADGVWMHGL
jgi:hypothetical protein